LHKGGWASRPYRAYLAAPTVPDCSSNHKWAEKPYSLELVVEGAHGPELVASSRYGRGMERGCGSRWLIGRKSWQWTVVEIINVKKS